MEKSHIIWTWNFFFLFIRNVGHRRLVETPEKKGIQRKSFKFWFDKTSFKLIQLTLWVVQRNTTLRREEFDGSWVLSFSFVAYIVSTAGCKPHHRLPFLSVCCHFFNAVNLMLPFRRTMVPMVVAIVYYFWLIDRSSFFSRISEMQVKNLLSLFVSSVDISSLVLFAVVFTSFSFSSLSEIPSNAPWPFYLSYSVLRICDCCSSCSWKLKIDRSLPNVVQPSPILLLTLMNIVIGIVYAMRFERLLRWS